MGRMPMVEARHLWVFEVRCLRTGVVAVHGIAAAVAKYATSWEGFPTRTPVSNTTTKRSVSEVRKTVGGVKRMLQLY